MDSFTETSREKGERIATGGAAGATELGIWSLDLESTTACYSPGDCDAWQVRGNPRLFFDSQTYEVRPATLFSNIHDTTLTP
ncbi:hypothetical protein L1049_016944 [Liquidambar formosana]|uniref:Uncharacterized protein n=1 Tax=Liquidambar formosana TaxID=63359 RepID=A0AAP0S035_LIQFO